MAKKKSSIDAEKKLRALYDLQLIDSQIDKIRQVRGELPLEVEDLEDEIEGLKHSVENIENEIKELNLSITEKKNTIEDAKSAITRYKEQQDNVRNNREFESLSKEIEYQELEIQLAEKRIKEYKAQISHKDEILTAKKENLNNREEALKAKKVELDEITSETQKEEEFLLAESKKASENVDDRLLKAYQRLRDSSKNGLAIVPVDRGSSGGSFIKIPPQTQLDIASRNRIIVDEHSGRILVDAKLAEEESKKMTKLFEQFA